MFHLRLGQVAQHLGAHRVGVAVGQGLVGVVPSISACQLPSRAARTFFNLAPLNVAMATFSSLSIENTEFGAWTVAAQPARIPRAQPAPSHHRGSV